MIISTLYLLFLWGMILGEGLLFLVIGDFLLVIWWFVEEKINDLVILRSCGDGDLAIFVGDLVISTWIKLVILRGFGDGDLTIFVGMFVICRCLK